MCIEIQQYEYLFDQIRVFEVKSENYVWQKTVLKATKRIYSPNTSHSLEWISAELSKYIYGLVNLCLHALPLNRTNFERVCEENNSFKMIWGQSIPIW